MTRVCYLHVGMMKTGSTTIQAAFDGYDDGRLRYLPAKQRNHSALVRNVAKRNPQPHLRVVGQGLTESELTARVKKDRRRFRTMIRRDDHDMIISAEELTSAFGLPAVERLTSILRTEFDELRVIGYVREPVAFMTSILQQRTKLQAPPFDIAALYPDYRKQFGKWFRAVGADNVELIPFHRDHLMNGDLLDDFAHRVGARADTVPRPPRLNESLSAEAFAVLYEYRQARGGPRTSAQLAKANQRALSALQGFGRRPIALDRADCGAIIEQHGADIAWVEQRMGAAFPTPAEPPDDAWFCRRATDITELAAESLPLLRDHLRSLGYDVDATAPLTQTIDTLYGFHEGAST